MSGLRREKGTLSFLRFRALAGAAILLSALAGGLAAAVTVPSPARAAQDYSAATAAAAKLPRLHSLVVSSEGKIVFEYYARGQSANRAANIKPQPRASSVSPFLQ